MLTTSGSIVNGSGYLNHNERKFTRSNVDKMRIKDNINLKSQTLEGAYDELFRDSIDQYNLKQKRADRQKTVEGYLNDLMANKHKKGSEKPFYELIVQIGDQYDCHCVNNPDQAENAKKALIEFYRTFQERNPNLIPFHATIHMDEATPHLHLDYIPVAEGCYKQGLNRRNSLSKALELQGLGKHVNQFDNPAIRWQEQERQALREIAKSYGFNIVEQGKSGQEHLSVKDFKNQQDNDPLRIKADRLRQGIEVKSKLGIKYISPNELNRIDELERVQTMRLEEIEDAHQEQLRATERAKELEMQAQKQVEESKAIHDRLQQALQQLQAEQEEHKATKHKLWQEQSKSAKLKWENERLTEKISYEAQNSEKRIEGIHKYHEDTKLALESELDSLNRKLKNEYRSGYDVAVKEMSENLGLELGYRKTKDHEYYEVYLKNKDKSMAVFKTNANVAGCLKVIYDKYGQDIKSDKELSFRPYVPTRSRNSNDRSR